MVEVVWVLLLDGWVSVGVGKCWWVSVGVGGDTC